MYDPEDGLQRPDPPFRWQDYVLYGMGIFVILFMGTLSFAYSFVRKWFYKGRTLEVICLYHGMIYYWPQQPVWSRVVQYIHSDGQYILQGGGLHDNLEHFRAPRISVMFDKVTWTLLKHGPEDRVTAYYNKTVKAYRDAGYDEMAESMEMMTSSQWDVNVLNNIIHISGYVKKVCEDEQISASPQSGACSS